MIFSFLTAPLRRIEAEFHAFLCRRETQFEDLESEMLALVRRIEHVIGHSPAATASAPVAAATVPTTAPAATAHDAPAPAAAPTHRVPADGPTIAIVNASTPLKGQNIQPIVDALQIQVDRDFTPVWKIGANLIVAEPNAVPEDAWVILLLDHSDQQGALGYHDLTPAGNPVGKIFVADDLKYGLSWTVTLSHELLEMLGDPYIDTTTFEQTTNTAGRLYAYEVCDAVEDDSLGYKIGDVLVSDFVYPAFFESFRAPNSTQFSFRKSVNAPFEIAAGGYLSIFDVGGPAPSGWQQITSPSGMGRRLSAKGPESRKARRGHKPTV